MTTLNHNYKKDVIMRSLIVYSSKGGNTEKLAETVRDALPGKHIWLWFRTILIHPASL